MLCSDHVTSFQLRLAQIPLKVTQQMMVSIDDKCPRSVELLHQLFLQASREDASGSVGGAIDRQKSSVVFQRYYHLFDRGELDSLLNKIPGVKVVDSFYDKSKWCCVFEKLV